MGNVATTVEEQIEILRKRGLELDYSVTKIKEILLDIGYYRLGFYWNPFEKNSTHDFENGSKFSDAVSLYYLDVDLRNLLLKCLNRIEINFKTCLIYYVSNKYKESPTWFINSKLISNNFIVDIDKFYSEDFKKKNKAIKTHHLKYINDKYAPAWKTLEFFTFGTILKLYLSLKDEDLKKEIAFKFGIKSLKVFENHLRTIIFVRNICAHGGVVFDLKTPKGISNIPVLNFYRNDNHSLDAAIKLITFYLGKISTDRESELKNKITELINPHKNNIVLSKIIETKIGYLF